MDNFEFKELDKLTDVEREAALQILKEYSVNGNSKTYADLILADYAEIPVDIITFIKDDRYMGNAWHTTDGKCKLYPFWEEKLKQIFPDAFTTNYNNVLESGARGLGKSDVAVVIAQYHMYRVMCLKDPLAYFNLRPTEKICFAFMNITKTLAEDIANSKFQNSIKLSPWFLERGTLTGRNKDYWEPPEYIQIIIGSQASHVIGLPIYFAFMDEISFIRNQDIDKQKAIAINMVDTAIGGMKTRFIKNGKNPTMMILASSKRSEKSFLEEHMKKKLADEDALKTTLIIDEAVWDVKPAGTYSDETFNVAVGNKFLNSEIVYSNDVSEWINKGYKIIKVPIDFLSDFRDDIDRALQDFAGISSTDISKYISGARLLQCKTGTIQNLFTKEIIEVGNAKDDIQQYWNFIDLDRIPDKMKSMPMFIHLDMSKSGDKTGIAGIWIKGKKPSITNTRGDLYYQVAFNVSIQAPKGYEISFAKNREFIYWLKSQGFSIRGISTDTYQNAALAQDFIAQGYNYQVISVDRTNNDRICEPYAYFKNTIYEQRLILYQDCDWLTEEITSLERSINSGKIDHPEGGHKDASDAICGAIWNASQHADEFAFEYGEDIEHMTDISSSPSEDEIRKQITVDFEEELKKLSAPPPQQYISNINPNMNAFYLSQGIII